MRPLVRRQSAAQRRRVAAEDISKIPKNARPFRAYSNSSWLIIRGAGVLTEPLDKPAVLGAAVGNIGAALISISYFSCTTRSLERSQSHARLGPLQRVKSLRPMFVELASRFPSDAFRGLPLDVYAGSFASRSSRISPAAFRFPVRPPGVLAIASCLAHASALDAAAKAGRFLADLMHRRLKTGTGPRPAARFPPCCFATGANRATE